MAVLDVEGEGLKDELWAKRDVVFEVFDICFRAVETARGRRRTKAMLREYCVLY